MASLWQPGPYHIISYVLRFWSSLEPTFTYGTLLGTTVFHSFINATASFKVLERPQFAILQRALFPAYFGIQTIFPVVLALTYPGSRVCASGLRGVLDEYNSWGVLAPLATAFATGLVNWAYYLPATNAVTAKRRDQETKDGKRSWDAPPHSQEMAALNKQFGQLHGISSLLNMMTFGAIIAYGFNLGSRIQ
ncbi:hypothetical protein PG996_002454 [Apiospora saccharicola]|uniref:TMEM205-like domain-containing protein n=1 Tax=Apiospora saccharicola TaxID=335842 RepID=A0ABR1WNR9_9PEZI